MSEFNLISYEDFTYSFTPECKIEFSKKLKEYHLKSIDIVVFINCVHLNFSCKEVAEGLNITIDAVRRRLAKVRKKFPELREFNKNAPTKKPKRFSKTHGEEGYRGPDIEISDMKEFNDEDIYKFEKRFEKRDLGEKQWDDEENRMKKKF